MYVCLLYCIFIAKHWHAGYFRKNLTFNYNFLVFPEIVAKIKCRKHGNEQDKSLERFTYIELQKC